MAVRARKERRIYKFRPNRGVTVKVAVGRRDDSPAAKRFFACAHFGRGGFPLRGPSMAKLHGACGVARNPRKAIAIALRKAAARVAARKGAFARYRR